MTPLEKSVRMNKPGVVYYFIKEVNIDPTRYDQVEWHTYRCTYLCTYQSKHNYPWYKAVADTGGLQWFQLKPPVEISRSATVKWLICKCQITICVSIVYKVVWIVIVATRYHIRITTRHHCTFWSVNCIMLTRVIPQQAIILHGTYQLCGPRARVYISGWLLG